MFRIRTRKAIALVALGIFGVLALDRGMTAAAHMALENSDFRFSQLYHGDVDTRIAIFGNSRGVHSWFSPHLADATCGGVYNFSFNGLTLPAIKILITDYLDRNPAPKFVILELPKLADPGADMVLRTYASQSEELSGFIFRDRTVDELFSKIIESRGWYSEIFLRSLLYFGRSDQGWIIGSKIAPESLTDEWNSWTPSQKKTYIGPFISDEPEKIAILSEIADAVEKKGAHLVTVISPFLPAVVDDPTFNVSALDNDIKHSLKSVTHLDLSRFISNNEMFADRLHMNKNGSVAFIDSLISSGIMPNLSQCN